MIIRVGYDLYSIHKLSGRKFKLSEIGEWLVIFAIFGYFFMLIEGGFLASQQLLQDNSINISRYVVVLIYVFGYEMTRLLYFKKHPEHLLSKKFGIFLSNSVFTSGGVLLLVIFTFILLYIKFHT